VLIFLLGERQKYRTEAEVLLKNICDRYYLLSGTDYQVFHCYDSPPSPRAQERPRDARRIELLGVWERPDYRPVIVGFGWMACDILFRVGKSHMKRYVGCKWPIVDSTLKAWLTYDPAAALYDPNLVVDIAGAVVTAAKEDGHRIQVNTKVRPYSWSKFI
jgi:hypothetical protein